MLLAVGNPERERRLRDALQRGEERVFSASVYLCLRSSTAALDDLTCRPEAADLAKSERDE